MTTMQETKSVTDSLEVNASALIELLEGVSTHADKGKSAIRALNAVQIESVKGYLVARATDRYRLIEGRIELESGDLATSLIALDDIKRVLTIAKESKVSDKVGLNRIGDLLTVSSNGSSITITVLDVNYPPSFDDLLNKSERENLGEVSFNPAYMADYAKIAGKGNAVRLEFTGQGKPIIVHLPDTKVLWRALLMPMRIK